MANLVRPYSSRIQVRPRFRLAQILLLATIGSLSGIVPGLTRDLSRWDTTTVAHAQDLLPKLGNYADAVLQMEPLRINALNKVRSYMGNQTPKNICRQDTLPSSVKTTCTDFYNRSADVIRQNGLSNWEFNQITEKVRTSPRYRQRLDEELMKRQ